MQVGDVELVTYDTPQFASSSRAQSRRCSGLCLYEASSWRYQMINSSGKCGPGTDDDRQTSCEQSKTVRRLEFRTDEFRNHALKDLASVRCSG